MNENKLKCSLCSGRMMVLRTEGGLRRCPACSDIKISPVIEVQPSKEILVKEEIEPGDGIEVVKFRKKAKRGKAVKKK